MMDHTEHAAAPPAPPEREGEQMAVCECGHARRWHADSSNGDWCQLRNCGCVEFRVSAAPEAPAHAEALPADVEREDECESGDCATCDDDCECMCHPTSRRLRAAADLQRSSQIAPELAKSAPAGGEPVALLRRYQWSAHSNRGRAMCPACNAYPQEGHLVSCPIGSVLSGRPAPAPQPETGALEALAMAVDVRRTSCAVNRDRHYAAGRELQAKVWQADVTTLTWVLKQIAAALRAAPQQTELRTDEARDEARDEVAATEQTEVEHG